MSHGDWGFIRSNLVAIALASPAALVAGVAAFAAVQATTETADDHHTAIVELGVTQEVTWPFFDVVFEEAVLVSEEQEPAVQSLLGDSLVDFTVDQPEALLLIEITVVADDPGDAIAGAELAGDQAVSALEQARLLPFDETIAVLEARIVEVTDELSIAEADLAAALAAATEAEDEAALLPISDDAADARSRIDDAGSELRSLESDIAGARLDRSLLQPQVGVVGRTSPEAADTASSNRALAIAVGAAAAVGLAGVALVRSLGRVHSVSQASTELGIPTIDASSLEIERTLHRCWANGHRGILVDAVAGASDPRTVFPIGWQDEDHGDYMIDESSSLPLVVVSDEADARAAACRGVIVFAECHRSSLLAVKRLTRRHSAAGLEVVAVVLS